MSLKERVFLVDVDNTLINTDHIRSLWRKNLGERFDQAYENAKKYSGFLDVEKIAEILSIDKTYFYNTPFRKFLYKDSLKSLKTLRKMGKVIIFSLGNSLYQKTKIQKSGIEKAVGKDNVILSNDKNLEIKDIISKLNKDYARIVIIDDRSDLLESVAFGSPKVITIWIKQGKYKNISTAKNKLTTFYTNSLSEAVIFLKSFIDVLPQNKLDRQISLIRGIYGNYVNQLIAYTKKDVLVGKFTHDKERFKNKKSFSSWMKHNKTIYTLVNSNQKMLGIIWFAKEKYEKYKYTFAIRTYPPLRGKGLAIKSIRSSFSDFDPNRKKSFWLSTNKENLIAKNVYKKIGFKEVETKENLIVMAKNN